MFRQGAALQAHELCSGRRQHPVNLLRCLFRSIGSEPIQACTKLGLQLRGGLLTLSGVALKEPRERLLQRAGELRYQPRHVL